VQRTTSNVQANYSETTNSPALKSGHLLELRLLIEGYAKCGEKDGLDYYIFKCKRHGKVLDYPHGHDEFLICHQCEIERVR
jgi:hypothetical protein